LKQPRDVLSGDDAQRPQRDECAEWIAAVEIVVKHHLVRRRIESGHGTAVCHHMVREREPCRSVVEGYVAREGRGPRQDDRCREADEGDDTGADCPRIESSGRPGAREEIPQDRDRHDRGDGELRSPSGCGGKHFDDDERREPDRRDQWAGERPAGDALDQEPASADDDEQNERRDEPAEQERHVPVPLSRRPDVAGVSSAT
jgi:hypothetical protein